MSNRHMAAPRTGIIGNIGALKVPGTLSPFLLRMITAKLTMA